MVQRSDIPERVHVGEAQIVDERRIVDVGVQMDDVQRRLVLEAPHDRIGHRMVSAEHHRQGTGGEDRLGEIGRIVEGAVDIGRPDVNIADVGDGFIGHLVGEVSAPGQRIVEPGTGACKP